MINGLEKIINWINLHGSAIIEIILYAFLFYIIFRIIVWRITRVIISKVSRKKDLEIVKQRAHTLRDVFLKTGQIIFLIGVFVAILQESKINIAPLIAGLGVFGIAVGFGTQNLVKDLLNGFFIIMEGQFSKGDLIEIGDKNGKVENVSLRKTILRDIDGTVHHIPNSLIGIVSNKSQEWASLNIDIRISAKENLDKVMVTLAKVSRDLYSNKEFCNYMLEEPSVLGVENIEEGKVIIKIIGRTKHLRKWEVSREFRKKIKEAFDKEGINFV